MIKVIVVRYFKALRSKNTFKKYQKLELYSNLHTMKRNTSVSLGDYFEDFVVSRITEGRYKNASEVIRAGLRLLEEEENKIAALRTAILEEINSGIATNFNSKQHLESLKAGKKQNG